MNILILAPFLLSDHPSDGGSLTSRAFLRSLLPRHNIHIVAFDGKEDKVTVASAKAEMEAWASSVRIVPYPRALTHKIRAAMRQVFLFQPEATFFDSEEFRDACRQALEICPIDIVIISYPQMAQYVGLFAGRHTIMDTQDIFSVSKFRRFALPASPLTKLARAIEWLKWVHFERRYYKRFNHIIAVSEQDRYGLNLFLPEARISVLPRLIDPPRPAPAGAVPTFHIGFIGTFGHEPNILSVKYLLQHVVPLVRLRIPELKVLIAGRHAPPELLAMHQQGAIEFAGFLPSVDEFYAQIAVIAAPIVTGGGIKIKILEGLLSGLPVVTTSIGAEGIALSNGVNGFIGDTPATFADAIVTLLQDAALRFKVGAAGKAHALRISSREDHDRLVDSIFHAMDAAQ